MGQMDSIECEIRDHTGLRYIALPRENLPDIDGTQDSGPLNDVSQRQILLLTGALAPVIRVGC
jgi:hypothetical protein